MKTVRESRSRQTGTIVAIIDRGADDEEVLNGDARWETVCTEHGTVCSHETRKLAEWFGPTPLEWCEECMTEHDRSHDA